MINNHLNQAEHNEFLAKKLIQEPPFHDWGITIGFYSAIHYIETWHFKKYASHTEATIPVKNGKMQYSAHTWREKIVNINFGKETYISFRKLRNASRTARYLYNGYESINKTAFQYYSVETAEILVNSHLDKIKKQCIRFIS